MQQENISFYDWQQKYSTQEKCLNYISTEKWPNGFVCPHCENNHGYYTANRYHYECSQCHKQTSIISGTLFENTKIPLTKWFWAIYWISSDKGGISAVRLSKLIGCTWRTAYRLLKILRKAMGDRNDQYKLSGVIELDDAYVGGKKTGKRGRGAGGKTSVVIACETSGQRPGFIAMQAVESVNKKTIEKFTNEHIDSSSIVNTDAFCANVGVATFATHIPKVTPSDLVDEWLPWVHIAISNLKRFLLGTFHGISKNYVQEYLNEFCYRFNRRFWEGQIPNRLLKLCIAQKPIKLVEQEFSA
jgi:transposase-like protein